MLKIIMERRRELDHALYKMKLDYTIVILPELIVLLLPISIFNLTFIFWNYLIYRFRWKFLFLIPKWEAVHLFYLKVESRSSSIINNK